MLSRRLNSPFPGRLPQDVGIREVAEAVLFQNFRDRRLSRGHRARDADDHALSEFSGFICLSPETFRFCPVSAY